MKSLRNRKKKKKALSPSKNEYHMVVVENSLAINQGIREEQVVPI